MFILINSVLISAITGSMGNAKMILYPEVNGWFTTTIEKTILTKNVNDVPIKIRLERDLEAIKFIELIDEGYILEPGTEKKAQFLVKVKKEGRYEGRINVFFSAVEGKEAGVVLSSQIIVIAKKAQDYEEINEEEQEGVSLTGAITEQEDKEAPSGTLFLSISSGFLLLVLGYLILLMIKNKKKVKKKKK